MYIGKVFKFELLWHFARRNLLRTLLVSGLVCVLYAIFDMRGVAIPFLPIGTIGTAVAFYIGFKNNQAYDRLWEARRLWGSITNSTRSFSAMIVAFIPDKTIREDILNRHIAYINILRLQLRRTIPWATNREKLHQTFVHDAKELGEYEIAIRELFQERDKMDIYDQVKNKSNIAASAMAHQMKVITKLRHDKTITDFEHTELVRQINDFYNWQGGCERIKTTPLFRQYSIFSRVFVDLFICLLPFGLITEMIKLTDDGHGWQIWLTIPFSMLISWVFFTMEQVGEFSENPFDSAVNDIPMTTICRNLEIEILELLGKTDLPSKIEPHDDMML
jgi:ion channel-forming bestrophin family protein